MSRVFGLEAGNYAAVREVLLNIVPGNGAAPFHEALLDLVALVCVKRLRCDSCPLADRCSYVRTSPIKHLTSH